MHRSLPCLWTLLPKLHPEIFKPCLRRGGKSIIVTLRRNVAPVLGKDGDVERSRKPMETRIKSKAARSLLVAGSIVVFILLVGYAAKAYLASVFAKKPTIHNLEIAIKLDPKDANYHLALGRLYEYLPASSQPENAAKEFRRAAELSPNDPRPWLELAAAAEFQGDVSKAEEYLRQADADAPHLPLYQWPIGNYYLLHGNVTEAFRHLRVVLAGTRVYDQILFSTAWKASGDAGVILDQLIPHTLDAEFSYLNYLLAHQQYDETFAVWKRILATPGNFPPQMVGGYLDSLINLHRVEEAFQVWKDLQQKGAVPYPGDSRNLINNGGFEDEMLGMGFGWRVEPVGGVYVGLDTVDYHSPGHSLLVQFSGNANLNYHQVFQYVKVNANTSYRLQAFLKTEGISTDSGPRLEVRDAYDGAALSKETEDLTGSTNGWTPLLLDFKTGPRTVLLAVGLARLPSQKLDNLITGKVWLDDVQLTATQE